MFIGHKLASPLLNAVVVPHGSYSHLLAASGGCWCTWKSRVLHLPSPSQHTCTSCTFPPSVFCHGIWGVYQINTARWTSHSHWEPTAPHDKQRRWGGVYNRPLYTTFSPLSAPRHDWVAQPAKAQPFLAPESFESQGWSQDYPLHNPSPTPWQPMQKMEETRLPGPFSIP